MSEPNYVLELVRRQDRDRFVAALFASAIERARLLAVYAFNIELARIPETVSEPMLGQMRLQWWRDLVDKLAAGGAPPTGHPVSEALAAVPGLDRTHLLALIDARESRLTGAPKAATVEPAGAALAEVALDALGVGDEVSRKAAHEAAIAHGLATLHFKTTDEQVANADHARAHISAARAQMRKVDKRALPVLLWTTAAAARLRDPSAPVPVLRILWNAWRGRY